MDLNTAKFNDNGRCGYILKPAVMRESKIYSLFLKADCNNYNHLIFPCRDSVF